MKGIVFFAASAAALCASATITVATNGTAVTVSVSANPSSVETLSVPFLSPDVSSVVFSITNGLYYYPASGSTDSGGTDVERGQLYIMRSDALGTGPIRIGASGFDSSLLARGASVVLTNKVVFGPKECYAVGMNNDSLTLKSIGVVESGSTKRIRLGRTSAGGASSVCLSLTDPESEQDTVLLGILIYLLIG